MNTQMQKNNGKGCLSTVLILGLLLGAVLIAVVMMKTRVTPEKVAVSEIITPVEVMPVRFETVQITIPAQGTVTSAVQIAVRPEVAGKVTEISPDLVPGGTFASGDVLFVIDQRDYRITVANRRQALAAAELALKQEQARGRVAAREWDLLESSVNQSEMDKDLALRIPQLNQAEAAVEAARRNLDKALLDLSRCTVKAPFNGIILTENVDLGQLVSSNTDTAIFTGTDEYWVQLSIPVDTLRFINFPTDTSPGSQVLIRQSTGNGSATRTGTIVRLLGDMMESGRLARILVAIPYPTQRVSETDIPLLIGAYVNAEIQGLQLDNVIRIPRSALHSTTRATQTGAQQRDAVWIMDDDDRLTIQPVTVDWRTADEVYMHNSLTAGDRLILSTISAPIQGMKLTELATDRFAGGTEEANNER